MDAALGGEMDFQFFHAWFNGLFLASAAVSIAVCYAQYKWVRALVMWAVRWGRRGGRG
jgi:hypothetical protein